ncbi:hypothetical protein AURDEDRAFT_178734, partial [Auricularia subglabra TFB-10046 SS5]
MAYYSSYPAAYAASASFLGAPTPGYTGPGPTPPANEPWAPPPPLPQPSHSYMPSNTVLFDSTPSQCPYACYAPLAPPVASTVPVYNVSYSLAGALTPVDESKPQRALAQTEQLQSPLGGVPAFWPGTETSGMLAYSPDVPSSSEESFYGPESSSCSSLSPSPSPPAPAFLAVKEELPHSSL